MDKNDIGAFLNNIRVEKNLSQQQLAELAGFTRRQQIMEIEQAKTEYGVTVLVKTLEALGYVLSIIPIVTKETAITKQEFDFIKTKPSKKGDNYEQSHFTDQRKEKLDTTNPI